MKTARTFLLSAALALLAGSVMAQAASAPPAAASGPRAGMGPRMGQGMGPGGGQGGMHGPRAQAGQDNTPGWGMMNRAERQEHRSQMRSMKTEAECRDYLAKHHETMAARAKDRGVVMPGPKRDACAGLPK